MKFPKNRENCFIALRDIYNGYGEIENTVPCGVFANFADCEDYCGACEQEWREKYGKGANVSFRPYLTTFYG